MPTFTRSLLHHRAPLGLVAALCLGCGAQAPAGPELPRHEAHATSPSGMVVTGSPYATEAGLRMLEAGGNAVDAAVAAAFALAVAEPTQSGLGGRTQMVVRMADGTVHAIDGTTQVPAVYDAETAPTGDHGYGAVGIPGTVAALTRALSRHGTFSLDEVVAPAEAWARTGILLPEGEALRFAGIAGEIDPASEFARTFLGAQGAPPEPEALLVQPALASTMGMLAEGGREAFYSGEIARRIAGDMAANGGFVTAEDLSAYEAADGVVGRGSFGDLELVGSYLPASGVTVIEILQILDRLTLDGLTEAQWYATVAEALLAGFEDREVAEHWEARRAVEWLTSDSLAQRRAGEIAGRHPWTRLAAVPSPGAGAADAGAPPEVVALAPAGTARRHGGDPEPAHTTHLSVADAEGNVVALTQSLGPTGGSRVVTPGLGFVYASTLGGYLSAGEPGYRPWSSQAPLIVLRDGEPVLVLGGAGARRILSALVMTLLRYAHGEMELGGAMAARRLHPTGGEILVEEGWEGRAALEALGYSVQPRERTYFARLNAVELRPDGSFLGVGEPRWMESAAAGPRR